MTTLTISACQSQSPEEQAKTDRSKDAKSNADNWQLVNLEPLHARHEAGFVALNGKLYLLGGRGIKPVNEIDPVSLEIRNLAKPPIEIHHFQPVVFDNKIWIVGAMTGPYPDETPLTHILIFDPVSNSWEQGATIPENRRRGGAGVSLYQGKFYISGGITRGHRGGTVTWFDQFDPKTSAWVELEDMPYGRDHFQSDIIDGALYAAGGRTTSQETGHIFDLVVTKVDVFDFSEQSWLSLDSDLPTGRAGNSTVAIDEQLWVIGGESGSQKTAHDQVEIYDVSEQRWFDGPDLQRGRHGTGIGIIDNQIWTASGSGNRGGAPELKSLESIRVN